MNSGAQIMVKCLEAEGVEIAFGYPGAAICPFYDALYQSKIRHVLVRTEQNAAHMASGYARMAGKPGVCIATSGPGATNLITGIATAYMDSIPLVAITGQVNLEQLGRDVFQEADITGACHSFTKHSYLVKSAGELPRVIKEAFHIAATGRPGPVLIDVPQDVQEQTVESFSYPERAEIRGYKPNTSGHPLQIKRAAQALERAQRPVIICGGGVVSAGAREEMMAFSRKTGIPAVATMMGLGVFPGQPQFMGKKNPVYLGMIGRYGRSCANRAVKEADLILLCGARVGDRAIAVPHQIAEQAQVIHIDIDPAEIGKNMRVDVPIVGDIRQVPAALGAKLASPKSQVVAVCGDGAFQMSLCELATIRAVNAAIKVVVLDNRRLGMVRELQNQRYACRHMATHMDGNPDFVALCQAYGIPAARAENNAQASALAREMLRSPSAYVLVCRVDPDTPSI